MTKQKLIPFAALVLTLIGGSALGISRMGSSVVHAQTPTVPVQTVNKVGQAAEVKDSAVNEKPETATEKDTIDGPGGHQDPQGANVDHQFDGAE